MNHTFFVCHFVLFLYFTIKLEDTSAANPPLGTCLDNLCYFSATAIVVLNNTSGAVNSVPTNKYVYLSAKHGVAPRRRSWFLL